MKDLLPVLTGLQKSIRMLLTMQSVTVAAASPLRVTLPDGSTVAAVAVTGLTYTVGGRAVILTAAEGGQFLAFPTT